MHKPGGDMFIETTTDALSQKFVLKVSWGKLSKWQRMPGYDSLILPSRHWEATSVKSLFYLTPQKHWMLLIILSSITSSVDHFSWLLWYNNCLFLLLHLSHSCLVLILFFLFLFLCIYFLKWTYLSCFVFVNNTENSHLGRRRGPQLRKSLHHIGL